MAKKLTYEFVKKQFESKGYRLLENEYFNSKTPMKFLCPKHGEVSRNYNSIQSGKCCPKCGNESPSIKSRLSYDFVKNEFYKCRYELISSTYIDNASPLEYICAKHRDKGIQTIIYNSLQQNQGCYYCGKERTAAKLKLNFDKVQRLFQDRKYNLLSTADDYINSRTNNIKYICPNHPNNIQSTSYKNLKGGYGCPMCAIDNNSGENNWNWKGGITSLVRYLRPQLDTWVQQQLQRVNYRCELTDRQGTLNVHHMFSFKKILDITMDELKIDFRETIGEYSEDELQLIRVSFMKNNEIFANPIVLLESVHQELHSFCGGNNVEITLEQWDEFKKNKILKHIKDYEI